MARYITDLEALNAAIEASGMTLKFISERTEIPYRTLYNRLKGLGEFTGFEIASLSEVLNLRKPERDKIFLTLKG